MWSQFVSMDNVNSAILESPTKACILAFSVISLSYIAVQRLPAVLSGRNRSYSHPPGPPREFLIGTLRHFPKARFAEVWSEWAVTYGNIVYAPLPGMKIVVLNSYEVAQDLLGKRASSTARRLMPYLVCDLMGWDWDLAFIQPGPHHSNQRKMLRRVIGPQTVGQHDPLIESTVAKFMTVLETFQGNPNDLVQYCVGEFISKAAFGNQVWSEMGQELSRWNVEAMDLATEASFTVWLVDIFHFLRFIPDWVPLRFKKFILASKPLTQKIRDVPYQRGLELYKSGALDRCILSDLLDEFGESQDVQDATAILYAISSDTTTGGIIQFLHSLFLFPDVADRVFKEVQSVTQGLRLPQISDQPKLPYTEAVWKEAVRWRPFIPVGIPHVNEQDEILQGYFIEKGTIIHQNNMRMLTDPAVWGDPEIFRPERFLEPDASQRPNPLSVLFGWGLRVCAGMHLADRLVLHIVTMIISLYKVEPLEGEKIPDPESIEYTSRVILQPVGFRCRFVPRDEEARNLLKTISVDP